MTDTAEEAAGLIVAAAYRHPASREGNQDRAMTATLLPPVVVSANALLASLAASGAMAEDVRGNSTIQMMPDKPGHSAPM